MSGFLLIRSNRPIDYIDIVFDKIKKHILPPNFLLQELESHSYDLYLVWHPRGVVTWKKDRDTDSIIISTSGEFPDLSKGIVDGVRKMKGHFTVAILSDKQMRLATDISCTSPVYYAIEETGGSFLFSTVPWVPKCKSIPRFRPLSSALAGGYYYDSSDENSVKSWLPENPPTKSPHFSRDLLNNMSSSGLIAMLGRILLREPQKKTCILCSGGFGSSSLATISKKNNLLLPLVCFGNKTKETADTDSYTKLCQFLNNGEHFIRDNSSGKMEDVNKRSSAVASLLGCSLETASELQIFDWLANEVAKNYERVIMGIGYDSSFSPNVRESANATQGERAVLIKIFESKGLQVICPYLDRDVVCFMETVPQEIRTQHPPAFCLRRDMQKKNMLSSELAWRYRISYSKTLDIAGRPSS